MCNCSLRPTDLHTATGVLTLETYASLRGQEDANGLPEPQEAWREVGAERAGHERIILVPGYAIRTVIGQSGSQLESFRSSYPQVLISIVETQGEDTFAGPLLHQMEFLLEGPAEQVDQLARCIQMLYDRAGPLHIPPTFETPLIRAFSPSAGRRGS